MEKTNVMRLLDAASISYKTHYYDKNVTDGVSVAHLCEENEDQVFKTLVTIGNDKNHYVFCIPVNSTLDLKKGAKVVGVKNIEMIPQKEYDDDKIITAKSDFIFTFNLLLSFLVISTKAFFEILSVKGKI